IDGVTGKSYTFRQLKDLVYRCGSGLTKAGFHQGDVCVLYLPNLPEFFVAFYGIASIGGTVSPANPVYTVYELTTQLKHSGAQWMITTSELAGKARQAAQRVSGIKALYVIGDESMEGCRSFVADLMEDDGSAFPINVRINPAEDVVALPYSSGTTGLPKGVMLTHRNMVCNLHQMRTPGILDLSVDDVMLCVLPFYHSYGMVAVLANALSQGAKLVTMPKFEPQHFLQLIEKYKITQGLFVPPIILFLIKHPMVDQYDLSSLVYILSAAAPLGPEHITELKKKLKNENLIVRQGYGLTETSTASNICSRYEEFHPGSVGPLLPNTLGKVVDLKTGENLAAGQDGEICLRGPQIMKGYLNNIQATNMTVKDGWLYTGDIGHYDNDGHFYIVGRLKELIKYKGFQIAPAELEALLLTHPQIQDVAVIGIPDDDAGELPKAFIVPKTDQITVREVIKFVEETVSPHKRLRGGVQFVEEVPKSASGKILRRVLKDAMKNMK
uniref:4-coumarate--CoA ligase 1-like n=1 Tax=Saccoglossus kowalevskii TaxID=10224 RepID=A0ABM0MT63_SACKO